jgi:SNF2 family DNA or RNA helicase
MIRRTLKDVVKDLPPLNRVPRDVEISEKAYKLYQKVLQGIYEVLAEMSPTEAGQQKAVQNILVQIGRLKQICAIACVDDTADLARTLYEQSDESDRRKVIIFSQYKAVAYAIWQRLADDGASCFVSRTNNEFITANADDRDRLVQEFQTDPSIKYLVVTEKTTKEGHNITAAGHVIFNDLFWTPAGHDQAIGRAYGRMADMHGVDAYFQKAQLPAEDEESIADWIWGLLGFKQGVIDMTVENIHSERTESSIQMQIVEKLKELAWTKKRK